jgi:hypothetical protein
VAITISEVAGCIATPCNAKTGNRPPSNMQCSSVIAEDESDPDYQHSVNTFQESCSLDGISDSDDGEISVCCQPDATDGNLCRIFQSQQSLQTVS